MGRLVFADKPTIVSKPYRAKRMPEWRKITLLITPMSKQWWEDPDVVVAFNLPRITSCLERLMGTNIVRLTDRLYMKELRERIDADYVKELQKRIKVREEDEIERERILIIEGKTDIIPPELVDDPIFLVNNAANEEIQNTRMKLKSARERNSDRLKMQGVTWERERLLHEAEERARRVRIRRRTKQQRELEERYKLEDADRGMNLLRIADDEWRDCEENLRIYLEGERKRMKARSMQTPKAFTSDPKDVQNIERAKLKLELEKADTAPAALLDEAFSDDSTMLVSLEEVPGAPDRISRLIHDEVEAAAAPAPPPAPPAPPAPASSIAAPETRASAPVEALVGDDTVILSDDSSLSSTIDLPASSVSEVRARHAQELEEDIESDVQMGLLVNRDQYHHLRYEEEKILALRDATDIRELYRLAEDIIMGERIDDDEEEEEAMLEEEEAEEEAVVEEESVEVEETSEDDMD